MLRPPIEMEFPEERYYGLNRIFLSTVGLWPYDTFKVRQLRFIMSLLILISFASTQLMKLFVSEYDLDLLLKVLSFSILFVIISIKYITFYAIMENIKKFQERIRNSWNGLKDNREIGIICQEAGIGKLFTIFIAIFAYFMWFFYILTQYIPLLLDIVMPLNESRPRKHLVAAEYFIDQQKYFHIIAIHIAIGLFIFVTATIATESFSLVNASYAFGLFKIASYRMEHILNENDAKICMTKKYMISHGRITAAVDMHRKAIEFSELLKASFGQMYLVLFVVIVISASINFFYLFRVITTRKDILEIIKSTLFIMLHLLSLTLANYAGQQFIDCDMHVYRTICNTQWYNAPLKTQKLILFLIQKTTKTYKVDAGGMFDPCLEGLATGLSMSVSYFMVFCSM